MRELRPDVVLCPDPTAVFFGDGYFNHRDHRVTGWATLDAIALRPATRTTSRSTCGRACRCTRCAPYLSGTLDPNCWIDIAKTQDRKIDALFRHESQLVETGSGSASSCATSALEAGRAAGVTYAEAFRRLVFV